MLAVLHTTFAIKTQGITNRLLCYRVYAAVESRDWISGSQEK